MPKTERLSTPTLVSATCDLYFYNILIFTCTHVGLSLGVSGPRQIACYKLRCCKYNCYATKFSVDLCEK